MASDPICNFRSSKYDHTVQELKLVAQNWIKMDNVSFYIHCICLWFILFACLFLMHFIYVI